MIRIYLIALITLLMLACSNERSKQEAEQPVSADRPGSTIRPDTYMLYKNFPSQYINPRNVEVWLPLDYKQLDSLPVLYMVDGQNIFHGKRDTDGTFNPGWQVDEVLDSLYRAGTVPAVMVVGIFCAPGMMRMSEYMPAKPYDLVRQRIDETDHHWYREFKAEPPQSDEQLKFIVEELKPFIDAQFRTKRGRENTFIAGSSMGGLISAYAICEYPEVFGGAACFSTHWPILDGVFLEHLKDHLPDPTTHRIYFDHGTEGLDAEYEPYQVIADAAMEAGGYVRDINWITLKFEGTGHYESYWNARFHIPMEFLLSEE